jgi:serine protease Do
MKKTLALFVVLLSACPVLAQGRDPSFEFTRNNPKFLYLFKPATAGPSASTMRVLLGDKEVSLGVVVSSDGLILTKYDELEDATGPITVRTRLGKSYETKIVGVHRSADLALLKIDERGLRPIEFADSKSAIVGTWIACVGIFEEPVAVGVVSVATRNVVNKGPEVAMSRMPFLGVSLEAAKGGGVRIAAITQDMPAAKAGLLVNDIVLALAGHKVDTPENFIDTLSKYKPDDVVTMRIRRGDTEYEKTAKLARRSVADTRSEKQNTMGSKLSERRTGYATILQHDSVVRPEDCGGPLVDLDGRVIGLTISRAGRVDSFALPSEVIRPILADMIAGKLKPRIKFAPEEGVIQAKAALAKLERGKSSAKEIDEAKQELQLAEAEFKAFRHKDSSEASERILNLMQERLLLMNAVAGWKWNHRQETLDSDRESASLAKLQRRAKELKVDPQLVERFFKAQIEAARLLQEERIAGWQKDNELAAVTGSLNNELRPQIDFLNDELLGTLAKVKRYWNESDLGVPAAIRQRSSQLVAGQGISPSIRAKALEGLFTP